MFPHTRLGGSELHGMRSIVFGERETRAQVLLQERALLVCLDVRKDGAINCLLVGDSISVQDLLLGTFSEEVLCVSSFGLVVSGEGLVGDRRNINASEVDLSAGRDGVDLVNALKGHAVHFVRASNEKKAARELLEEYYALASESA